MSKKIFFVFILLVVAFSMSACADAPGIQDSALPSDFLMRIDREKVYPDGEKFEIPTSLAVGIPTGDYVLLAHQYGTDQFVLSFHKDGKKVCSWQETTTLPTEFLDKSTIYVVEGNCPGMGDAVVSWDLFQNVAIYDGDIVSVWTSVGGQYFLLN